MNLKERKNIMLNYIKFMKHNPTVYDTITNSLGQKIDLVEHPIMGDSSEVLCVSHDLKLVEYSGFFDTDDMLAKGDYEPRFVDGKLKMKFDCE